MATALGGMAVLDLTQGVAGPYCTRLLAGLGAEVLKVEPPMGDAARRLGPFVHDDPHPEQSLPFLYLNTSKKGLTLNLETDAGRQLLCALAREVDIVVESFPPGFLPGLGLAYERLAADNPRLVMTSITWFGQDGPYRDYKGEEILAQALSGHLQITGEPDREPVKIGGPFAQYTGGQVACAATLMALFSAMTTGQGQQVDCAIVEANVDLLDSWGVNAVLGVQQPRSGMRHHNIYPAQIYPCQDGYVVLGTEPAGWQAFAELVGDEALRRPEYAGPERQRYREEIDAILCTWLRDRSKLEVYEAAQARRLASGYLMTPEDMLASPQLQARGYFQEVDHPSTGVVQYPGAPFRLSRTAWRQTRAPLLGEHNQQVYGQRLGLSSAELGRLRQQGVI